MRKLTFVSTVLLLILVIVVISHAAVPKLINYQGHITDKGGNPLTGTYSITFTIYDSATNGTALWTETQNVVDVNNGIFNVLLGSASIDGVPENVFNDPDRWLGVAVETDSEIVPRQQLVVYLLLIRQKVQIPPLLLVMALYLRQNLKPQ